MQAIILAGGLGTRLQKLVPDLPKALAPIKGKPFIKYLLEHLSQQGFRRVVLAVGYRHEQLIEELGDRYKNLEIIYSIETEQLGTGGAVNMAIESISEDHVFIFNGDSYLELRMDILEEMWQQHGKSIIVGVEVEDCSRYGALKLEDGVLVGFTEKGKLGCGVINAGCYVVNVSEFKRYAFEHKFSLEEDFLSNPEVISNFDLYISHGKFIDIGTPGDYKNACDFGLI